MSQRILPEADIRLPYQRSPDVWFGVSPALAETHEMGNIPLILSFRASIILPHSWHSTGRNIESIESHHSPDCTLHNVAISQMEKLKSLRPAGRGDLTGGNTGMPV